MTKLFVFLFTLTISALAAMWFIENDGSIIVEWLGYRIQTSVAFSALACVIFFVIFTTFFQFVLWLRKIPSEYKKSLVNKKRDQGLTALTSGFAAIAAGDTKQAGKLVKQAVSCLGNIPITRLLEAQTAQLDGDIEQAKVHYTAMLESKETEVIAIKGLLIQAEKDGDLNKAVFLAEKAIKLQPNSNWANKVLLRLYKITKNWQAAEDTVNRAAKLKVIDDSSSKKELAVIALAQCSKHIESVNNELALISATKAYKHLPTQVQTVTTYAQLLFKTNNKRKAAKILETNWKLEPHPSIFSLYIDIYNDEPLDKLIKRAERLLNLKPNHIEGHIGVAKIAILANDPTKARNHLKIALTIKETKLICKLMAEAEEMEGSSQDIINQWIQRIETSQEDPTWTCNICNTNARNWSISCNNCQNLDSLEWSTNDGKSNIANNNALLFDAG